MNLTMTECLAERDAVLQQLAGREQETLSEVSSLKQQYMVCLTSRRAHLSLSLNEPK